MVAPRLAIEVMALPCLGGCSDRDHVLQLLGRFMPQGPEKGEKDAIP